ncbi:18251_t:CDS:2 [Cetraspora pellucida]|uniref:18251_t:CDS:1 n=1 Tax=Cetraspora pellucida TaxID=1433469 RepID=A0ACA9KB93_9GLOM|nr:18251_t:CDS:2 [Cetraspora pellucida]
MTRKNRTPKEFLLTILNQHLKFLKRTKEKIPNKYHKDIETQEERTKNYYARVTKKEFVDYDTLRNEFEKEKVMFNRKIDNLKREIRRLNGVIRGKDKEIEMLRSDNNEKDKEIEMLRSDNNEKDKEIEILRLVSLSELLLEVCSYLSPKDLFSLMKVEKLLYEKLWSDSSISQLFWKFSRQRQPNQDHECPSNMTEQQYCFLNFINICQICNQPNGSALILELKFKICKPCRVRTSTLISRLTLEESKFPTELLSAMHSVDYQQLQGSYLDHSVRELSVASHLVFYLKKEVESTENEYLRVPENEKQEWLKKRTTIVREYYNNILKIKHPTIEDQYLLPQQQTSLQHQLTRQPSFVIPDDFNFE